MFTNKSFQSNISVDKNMWEDNKNFKKNIFRLKNAQESNYFRSEIFLTNNFF